MTTLASTTNGSMSATATGTDSGSRPSLPRRRSSRRLLLAVVLAVLGALLAGFAYRTAVVREGAVALVNELPYGAVVEPGDVREVQLPPDTGLAAVPWSDVEDVVGLLAATDLRAGQIVTADSVTAERAPAPGEAVVGLSLEPGRLPATILAPRDEVLVVLGAGTPPQQARVVRSGEADVAGRRTVDVLVDQSDAEELALASVEGRVAIVLVGRG